MSHRDTSPAESFRTAKFEHGPYPWTARLLGESRPTTPRVSSPSEQSLARPANRAWWKNKVFYQVWPRSFKDSNTTNNKGHGDIRGVIEKLDYLRALGVDVVWLCPVYKSPQKDFGYDISDYEAIDPDFGTMQDMDELITEVKRRGMRIILDLVINHTSDEHAWFVESSSSRNNPKADWYIWRDPKTDEYGTILRDENGMPKEPTNWRACLIHGSAWTWCETRQQFFLHCFLQCQPDLNWENEDCRNAVYESAIKFWMRKGVSGFRLVLRTSVSPKVCTTTDPSCQSRHCEPYVKGHDFH
jgi:glycosidase